MPTTGHSVVLQIIESTDCLCKNIIMISWTNCIYLVSPMATSQHMLLNLSCRDILKVYRLGSTIPCNQHGSMATSDRCPSAHTAMPPCRCPYSSSPLHREGPSHALAMLMLATPLQLLMRRVACRDSTCFTAVKPCDLYTCKQSPSDPAHLPCMTPSTIHIP